MNHHNSGLAHGTNGSPQLTLENFETADKAKENELKFNTSISNKFPDDNQHGKRYKYTISNGRINMENGIRYANFVIDKDGNLYLGNGHSFLAHGESVMAAGTIKVNSQGYIRRISNTSGHYQPTVSETLNYVHKLKELGLKIDNSWITIYHFERTKSGYIGKLTQVYNGKVKYLGRRFT